MAKFRLTPSDDFVKPRGKKEPWVQKESLTQIQLFEWAKWNTARHPDLALLFAVPNGIPIHGPQRFAIINSFKQQGLRPGVPDACLPVGRGGFIAKWLELKTRGGKLSADQEWWCSRLKAAGASVSVCDSFEQAVADLEVYLALPRTEAKDAKD